MREFEPGDREAAATFYRAVTDPTAKAILDYLIDHPDERVDGAALVRAFGLPEHRAVARAAYLMGRIASAEGRNRPWSEAQLGYQMSAPVAELFRQARSQATGGD